MPGTSRIESTPAARQPLAQALAAHVARTRYEGLSEDALASGKRFMLDTLAVAWAGSDAPGCHGAYRMLAEQGGKAESSVWAYGEQLPVASSAFLNSMFAAALDFDSMGRSVPTHINIVVLPAALAVAQRVHASGKDFLAALVLGCDLMHRIGASSVSLGQPHKGWFYTSIHGGFASAAASARLLRLDEAAIAHALGIAYSQAAGTQQANIEPSLTKRMQSAFTARAGVFAALLAQQGVTAPQAVFEGQYGLYKMYQDGAAERLLDCLGERYENGELAIKKFPSCGCNHTAIEGALAIAADHDLRPDDIDTIDVEISPYMNRLVGGGVDPSGDAQAAAQFNIRYSVACAITRRISVTVDPANNGSRGPMILRVRSRRHGKIVCRVEHEPGRAAAPLTEGELLDVSGADLVTAYVAGYEVYIDVGIRERVSYQSKGWHPTPLMGALGAAAACARLRRLDAAGVASALGLAAAQASGITASYGTMAKSMQVGKAAHTGVVSARLAANGMTAAADVLDHAQGFLAALSPTGELDLDRPPRIGKHWHIVERGLSIKRYPACYCVHRLVDGALELAAGQSIAVDDIVQIEVSLSKTHVTILKHHRPQTGLEAKFSAEFAVAAAGSRVHAAGLFADLQRLEALPSCRSLVRGASLCVAA